jgi:hypothetical protein
MEKIVSGVTTLETIRSKVKEYETDGQDYVFRMNSDGRWEISTMAEGVIVETGQL